MTEQQYYLHYYFNQDVFNNALKSFGLISHLTFDDKTQLPQSLVLAKQNDFNFSRTDQDLLSIPIWTILMIQSEKLIYWTNDTEILDISQINLQQLNKSTSPENIKIDISQLHLGQNNLNNTLGLKGFATFMRKEDLKYNQEYFERFVIVTINQSCISLIPFDKFNKTGGDYGYVWPAIAKVDKATKKLYGQGMRMADFEVDIEKACI